MRRPRFDAAAPLWGRDMTLAAAGFRAAAVIATVWTLLVTLALAGYATVTTEAGWGVVAMAAASAGSVVALFDVVLGRVPTEWIMHGPFAFRVARPRRGHVVHVAATVLQIAVFWGFFLVGTHDVDSRQRHAASGCDAQPVRRLGPVPLRSQPDGAERHRAGRRRGSDPLVLARRRLRGGGIAGLELRRQAARGG